MSSPMRHKGGALKAEQPPLAAPYAVAGADAVAVALTGAVLAVRAAEPVVAVIPAERAGDESLPCGTFLPGEHRTLEGGVRSWVQAQTGVELGFLEQLCTLGARSRAEHRPARTSSPSAISPLSAPRQCNDRTRATWRSWYSFFPWEDWRNGRPDCLNEIEQRLEAWAAEPGPPGRRALDAGPAPARAHRLRRHGAAWDEEKVAERYELLSEAGIVGAATEDATGMAQRLPRLVHPAAR